MNMEDKVDLLFEFIGFKIKEEYARIAITCSNYAEENHTISQDALAIVGDHVIKLMITSSEFMKNNQIIKKDLTKKYQEIESNNRLQNIGEDKNIKSFLFHLNTDLNGNKKLATSIEAIIGAIYLSEGIEKTKEFMTKIDLLSVDK
ncbi:MAG: ribonuclease III domain-containing protein [Acholeplasmataceae bacterium]